MAKKRQSDREIELISRVNRFLATRPHILEKRLFGGTGFLLQGNLLVGAWKECLIARIGPQNEAAALNRDHVASFDPTGKRPMKGWVMIEPDGFATEEQLRHWLELALDFVDQIPPKPGFEESPDAFVQRTLKF